MPTTNDEQQWRVLDFFSDEEGSSTLTIFINRVRFHIIANASKLNPNTKAGAEYHALLRDLHSSKAGHVESPQSNNSGESDSGVDVKESQNDRDETKEQPLDSYDVEATLKNWMVMPLVDSFDELAPPDKLSQPCTIQDWYHCQTRFCELVVSNDSKEIEAVELTASSALLKAIEKLMPQTVIPKYISEKLNVRIYSASELVVLESSDQPIGTPYHPCRIRDLKNGETYFLKVIDNIQPKQTKREIDILRRIKDLALNEQIHVPSLKGLVVFDNARNTPSGKQRFMGFLQTDIPDPKPLTLLLNNKVSQKKRNIWAKEVNRVKDLLHEHNIVWGDAKADNFVVDAENKLWIIDFGGGYTEGWIDEELNETEEGDDAGTRKIIKALKDPPADVYAPSDHDSDAGLLEKPGKRIGKRKRDEGVTGERDEQNKREIS